MKQTYHANSRLKQRGIRQEAFLLAEEFGARKGDKLLLGVQGLRQLIAVIDDKAKTLGKFEILEEVLRIL